MPVPEPVGVSAIVTAFERIEQTLDTIEHIQRCAPAPAEILVHVDANASACAAAIGRAHAAVRVILSGENIGPGGGRNKLVEAASHPFVASFDDDSYPIDADYFARIQQAFERFPDAWVLDAQVFERGRPLEPAGPQCHWVADFSGGGCAYRRARFLETGGYLPLPTAYGMEEVDLALRVHAAGGRVLQCRQLRVFHNSDLSHHGDPAITSASISNIALLAYLRYPGWMWGVGLGQCANRVLWLLQHNRSRGVLRGLAAIPSAMRRHRRARRPVTAAAVRSYLALRKRPVPA
jgi:GT2 family glycosyltransferase